MAFLGPLCVGFFDQGFAAGLPIWGKFSVWLLSALLVFTGRSKVVCYNTSDVITGSFTNLALSSNTGEPSYATRGVTVPFSSISRNGTSVTTSGMIKEKLFSSVTQDTTLITLTTTTTNKSNQFSSTSSHGITDSSSVFKRHVTTSITSAARGQSSDQLQRTTSMTLSYHLNSPGIKSSTIKAEQVDIYNHSTSSVNYQSSTADEALLNSVSGKDISYNSTATSSMESVTKELYSNHVFQTTSVTLLDSKSNKGENSTVLPKQGTSTKPNQHELTPTHTVTESTGQQTYKTHVEMVTKSSLTNNVTLNWTKSTSRPFEASPLHSTTASSVLSSNVTRTRKTKNGSNYISELSMFSSVISNYKSLSDIKTDSNSQYPYKSSTRTWSANSWRQFSDLPASASSVTSNLYSKQHMLVSSQQYSVITETLSTIPHEILTSIPHTFSVTDKARSTITVLYNLTVNSSTKLSNPSGENMLNASEHANNTSKASLFPNNTTFSTGISTYMSDKASLFSQTFRETSTKISELIHSTAKTNVSAVLSSTSTGGIQSSAELSRMSTNSVITEVLVEASLVAMMSQNMTHSHFEVSQSTRCTSGFLNAASDSTRIINTTIQTHQTPVSAESVKERVVNTTSLVSTITRLSIINSTIRKIQRTSESSSETTVVSQFLEISTITEQQFAHSSSDATKNFSTKSFSNTEQLVGNTSSWQYRSPIGPSSTLNTYTTMLLGNSKSVFYSQTNAIKNESLLLSTTTAKLTTRISTELGPNSEFIKTQITLSSQDLSKNTKPNSTVTDRRQIKSSLRHTSHVSLSSIKPSKIVTILTASEVQGLVSIKPTDSFASGSHRTSAKSQKSSSQSSLAGHISPTQQRTAETRSSVASKANSSQVNISSFSVQASTIHHASRENISTDDATKQTLGTSRPEVFANTIVSSEVYSTGSVDIDTTTTVHKNITFYPDVNNKSSWSNSKSQHTPPQNTYHQLSPTFQEPIPTSSHATLSKQTSVEKNWSERRSHMGNTTKTILTQSHSKPLTSHMLIANSTITPMVQTSIWNVTANTSLDLTRGSSSVSGVDESRPSKHESATTIEPIFPSTYLTPSNATSSNNPLTSSLRYPAGSILTPYKPQISTLVSTTFQLLPSHTSHTNISASQKLTTLSTETAHPTPRPSSSSIPKKHIPSQFCYSTTGQRCVCYRGQQTSKGDTNTTPCSELLTKSERDEIVVMTVEKLTPSRRLENKTKQVIARLVTEACNNGSYNCLQHNTTLDFATSASQPSQTKLNSQLSNLTTIFDTLINSKTTTLDSVTENNFATPVSLYQSSVAFLQKTINSSVIAQTTNVSLISPTRISISGNKSVKVKRRKRRRKRSLMTESLKIHLSPSDVTVVEMRPAEHTTSARLAFLVKYTLLNSSDNATRLLKADTLRDILVNNTEFLERELNVTVRNVGSWVDEIVSQTKSITHTVNVSSIRSTQHSNNPVTTPMGDPSAVRAADDDYRVMIVAIIVGVSCVLLLLIIIAIVLARMNSKWQGEFVPNNQDGTISPEHNTQEMIASGVDPAPRITDVPFKAAKTKKNNTVQLNNSHFTTSEI